MRRMAVLGCTLLLVAGCGGGGSSNVEEMMQVDPAEPETGSMEPGFDGARNESDVEHLGRVSICPDR